MRILIVTNTYPPAEITGVGALVYELAKKLDAAGHDVRVLTRATPPADDPWAEGTGGRKLFFPLAAARHAWRLARREPFDLVHLHESDGVLVALALRLARLLRRPAGRARLVATLQVSYRRERLAVRPVRAGGRVVSRPTPGERVFGWLRAPLLSLLGRLTARASDAVVAPSRVTAGELVEDYGARVAAVIPNGVSTPPRAAEPTDDTALPTILYAGRLRTRKAVAVLIEAFAELRSLGGAGATARLVIAGDGEHRDALEARVAELGLGEAVRFLGAVPRSEMVRLYATAQVFCLPSIYEGFPLAILEAMAAGLPVVSTTVSGIPEAVSDGESGLLVPPEDATALAHALHRLLADSSLRRAMGEASRRRVEEHFSIGHVAARYLELWQEVAER